MQDFKNSKIFVCGALIFNIHIFRFKMDAGLHLDIDFNTESKFSCSRSSFFLPLSGPSKPTKPMTLLSFFIHLMGLEGSPSVSKVSAIFVDVKRQQLQVKIESVTFVNIRPVYNTKESFEETADSLSPTDKPLY